MALINCPECNQEVSSLASECPKCAYPISGGGSTQASGGRVQTIEKTGKKYKLQKMLSSILIIAGVIAIALAASGIGQVGSLSYYWLMLVIGIVWYAITSFCSWWHHG